MFSMILQVILVLALFIPVRWLTYQITEVWGLPVWLDYRPWSCNLCLTFWSLMAVYLTVGLVFKAYVTLGTGVLLTVLNAVAMYVDQKNKTITLDEYDKLTG